MPNNVDDLCQTILKVTPNDVPITAMGRTIEIDLRQALGETEIPPALEPHNNILM